MGSRKRLGELMIDAGHLTRKQLDRALASQKESREKLGRILVKEGSIQETAVVEALSLQFELAVAPPARLRLVHPSRQALDMIPADVARSSLCLPIYFSEQEQSLTLVTANPQDETIRTRILKDNELSRLRMLIASESLLAETIARHYGTGPLAPPAPTSQLPAAATPVIILDPEGTSHCALDGWLTREGYQVLRVSSESELKQALEDAPEALVAFRGEQDRAPFLETLGPLPAERLHRLPSARDLLQGGVPTIRFVNFYLKTLDFFVSLLGDQPDAPSQRHLRQVSQMCRVLAKQVGLPSVQSDSAAIAGFLYQFGDFLAKKGLLGRGISSQGGPALVADLWEGFDPPISITPILRALAAEPEDLDEEPLVVGVVRAAANYLELRDGSAQHARVGPDKALRTLVDSSGTRFIPKVVDAIKELVAKESRLGEIEQSQESGFDILLVDKDRMAIEILELRLEKEGFRVRIARNGEEAQRLVAQKKPNLVISEITLPRVDGFELCANLKAAPKTEDVSFFFLSTRTDGFHVTKGLELGADDFLTKPVNLDILVSKVNRLVRLHSHRKPTTPAGVQGSLSEMGLFDLLQVLQLGMKTAKLLLRQANQQCTLHIDQGNLAYARLGELVGREAFFELCSWEQGTFSVVQGEKTPERNLHESNDFLLMEGLRRADERRAGLLNPEAQG